jgi:predicted ester cyclase
MSPGELKAFAKRYGEAWSSNDPVNVLALHSESSRLSVNDGEPAIGKSEIQKVVEAFMEGFPDLHIQVNDVVMEKRGIVFYCNAIATNSGPGGTGNKIDIEIHEIWTFDENGKFTEVRAYDDPEEFERQLNQGSS